MITERFRVNIYMSKWAASETLFEWRLTRGPMVAGLAVHTQFVSYLVPVPICVLRRILTYFIHTYTVAPRQVLNY